MKIIIDVMSGDKAPSEIIKGAVLAYREFGVEITMTGHRETIERIAAEAGLDISPLSIVNTDVVINMEDPALSVVRDKNTSSMAIGLQMLSRGEGDAFVSAGNTGALLAGATLIVRRIKGIHRAAIGTVMPFSTPVLLFWIRGRIWKLMRKRWSSLQLWAPYTWKKIYGLDCARVGLLNNGTEPTKGPALYKDAYRLLEASETINFVGNVEGKEVPFDACDVLVCDGFTGNIMLKTVEGLSKFFMSTLKGVFGQNLLTKASAIPLRGSIAAFKKQFDSAEHGGAPLLGISKPVIKAHGSSDARAILNAVRQAIAYIDTGIIYDIAAHASDFQAQAEPAVISDRT